MAVQVEFEFGSGSKAAGRRLGFPKTRLGRPIQFLSIIQIEASATPDKV